MTPNQVVSIDYSSNCGGIMSRNSFGFVAILLVIFGFGILNTTVGAQEKATLEQRVSTLEQWDTELQKQLNDGQQQALILHAQFEGWLNGSFIALMDSTTEYNTYFKFDPQLGPHGMSAFGLPLQKAIVVLRVSDREIDTIDLSAIVQKGDLMIAWRSFEPDKTLGVPMSSEWFVPAYYWNKQTGLAVAMLHADGSSQSGYIVK